MKYEIDATQKTLGRMATEVATLLRGKNLVSYVPNKLPDNEVTVVNLSKARFTGDKLKQKTYYRYSGYHGGITSRTLGQLWEKQPQKLFRHIVYRMLPKNRTRDKIIAHLKFK